MANTLELNKPIIAITGSAGKTTTKELLASILRKRWKTFKSPGNMNNWRSTRKHASLITQTYHAAVLEYGMRHAGQIRKHCRYIKPNIGIITNIGSAHLGNFGGDIRQLAAAKSELIQHMKQTGVLFINADDANSKHLEMRGFTGKIVSIGIREPADYRALAIKREQRGQSFQVFLGGSLHTFSLPLPGAHNVYNALFAVAAAHQLGFTPEQIRSGLASGKRVQRRLNIHRFKNGIRVIDDTFSANPDAVKAALQVLAETGKGKKIAVLGEMQEQGNESAANHKLVGSYAADQGLACILTYGQNAGPLGEGAVEAGFPPGRVFHFTDRKALHKRLVKELEANCTVLVKGSHDMRMHRTVRFLRGFLPPPRSR